MSADETTGLRRLAILSAAEPATRVLNAVAELQRSDGPDYHTIALFPEQDWRAWYVRCGRRVGLLRRATSSIWRRSNVPSSTCRATAVWVGWGAAAEQVGFVRLCERLGVTFVGPSAAALSRVVDRISAKTPCRSGRRRCGALERWGRGNCCRC